MKNTKIMLFIILFSFLFSSCIINNDQSTTQTETRKHKIADLLEDGFESLSKLEKNIIKEAYINFETKNIKTSRTFINELIKKHSAYIDSENERVSNMQIKQKMIIKVPKNSFDAFMTELSESFDDVRDIKRKSIDTKDVTEELIDIKTEVKVKKDTEQTYIKLLENAKNVQEVLEIQNELKDLRIEIESIEEKLKQLETASSYYTVNLNMYQYNLFNITGPVSLIGRLLFEVNRNMLTAFDLWVSIVLIVLLVIFVKFKVLKNKGKQNEHK